MGKDQWFERMTARIEELQTTLSAEQLYERISQLDSELKATGWTTLSEKRKRGKLAREITACGIAMAKETVKSRPDKNEARPF